MKWWNTAWLLLKDILLTGTGLLLIVTQVLARQPSDLLLVTGLTLTMPSAVSHSIAVLSGPSAGGHGAPESSQPSPSPGAPASPSSSPEATGE